MPSGVPFLKNGIQVGFTDFSEFSVAGGVPVGITEFGITPTSPPTKAIANDPVEGNYFSMSGQGFKSWGFGLDAFFGLMDIAGGELLARVFNDVPVDGRKLIGPAASMEGLVGQSEGGADFDCWNGSFYRPVAGDRSGAFATNNGSSSDTLVVPLQEAVQDDVWAWVRVRRLQNGTNPGTEDDWFITLWFGDIEDEPVAPDGSNIGQARTVVWAAEAIGWAMASTGAENEQRIAFLSFSVDPVLAAPPVPGEVTTWVPSNVPGATNWVPSNG